MAAGQIGKSGASVVSPVVVAFKDACDLVQILLQEMEVLIARGMTYNPKLAIPMHAQVWNQVYKFIKAINKQINQQINKQKQEIKAIVHNLKCVFETGSSNFSFCRFG